MPPSLLQRRRLFASLLLLQTAQVSASTFRSLPQHDELRFEDSATVVRQGNLDVVTKPNLEGNVSLCHLATLLPLSNVVEGNERIPYTTLGSLQGVAAMMLALSHLNEGNGSIVPEIQEMTTTCPQLRFTTELLDSQLDERKAIDHVIGMVQRKDPSTQPLPCAFVGSYRSAVTMPTSIITGLQGYPQWAALSTSSALDDRDQFPLAGRLNPSDDGTAVAAILFFQSIDVQHLAVLHTNDAYGNAYVNGLIQAAAIHAPWMQIQSVDLPFKASAEVLERRVKKLKETGFRYFFGIIFDALHYDPLMTEAVNQGIAGTGHHQWIFSDGVGVGRMISKKHAPDSPLLKASRGTGMITAVGGLPSPEKDKPYDRLETALRALTPEDLQYLSSKLPQYEDHPDYDASTLINDPNFFLEPGLLAPFLYDTVVAIGLSACQQVATGEMLTGPEHFQRTVNSSFYGASGQVAINPETGTREATSALFVLTNFVQDDDTVNADGSVGIKAVVTTLFQDGNWTTLEPYVFSDGTTIPSPGLPPNKVDNNYIHTAARVLILAFGGVILGLSVTFAVWTKLHSGDRVVKASQPIFLYIICVGTFLMGSSVLLLGVDDGIFKSNGCQVACLLFPWLASLGFALTASSLFSKTHRINMIVNQRQFRRVAVSALDVMKPMFCFVGITTVTLILWNVLDMADWIRETTEYDAFGRPTESVGYCSYEGALPYIITLGLTNAGGIFYACYEAYIARDVSTEYAESEYIFKSMTTVLVVCFVGIPVCIMVTPNNTTAFNCTIAGVVSACALSFQLYIFLPKINFNNKAVRDDTETTGGGRQRRRSSAVFKSQSSFSQNQQSFSLHSISQFSQSDGSSAEEFGMKVVNRRHQQREVKAENMRLKKQNKKLQKQIQILEANASGNFLVPERENSSRSLKSVTFDSCSSDIENHTSRDRRPSFAVSEAESVMTIDPVDHDDETRLCIAPF